MFSLIELIILFIAIIIIGIVLGQIGRKEIQKTKCPYCSCSEHCNIGVNVKSDISEDFKQPLACKRK